MLAAALEQGLPTSTSFNSPAADVASRRTTSRTATARTRHRDWTLDNSTSSGSFDMYHGTQQSVNTYFAQLEQKTGLCEPYALAQAMGVDLTDPDRERVPSFILGVADVSPLEMAGAYATFAARGKHCDNRPVTAILNATARSSRSTRKNCKQVMQESTADTVNDILRGVMQPAAASAPGSRWTSRRPARPARSTNNKAVWFNGYTPALATAAMIAGANPKGSRSR